MTQKICFDCFHKLFPDKPIRKVTLGRQCVVCKAQTDRTEQMIPVEAEDIPLVKVVGHAPVDGLSHALGVADLASPTARPWRRPWRGRSGCWSRTPDIRSPWSPDTWRARNWNIDIEVEVGIDDIRDINGQPRIDVHGRRWRVFAYERIEVPVHARRARVVVVGRDRPLVRRVQSAAAELPTRRQTRRCVVATASLDIFSRLPSAWRF